MSVSFAIRTLESENDYVSQLPSVFLRSEQDIMVSLDKTADISLE